MSELPTWRNAHAPARGAERHNALHRLELACCMKGMPATTALALGRLIGLLDAQAEDDSFEGYGLLAEVAEQIVEAARVEAVEEEDKDEAVEDKESEKLSD